jgi:ethanolamine utilization protein EutQ (cupin superfamily)
MELILELENKIIDILNEITPDINETISSFISTRNGMKSIVTMIKKKVIYEKMSIGEAINTLTLELGEGFSE